MPARKTELPPHGHIQTLLANNPCTPTSTLAQVNMHSSVLLTELVVVREWHHEVVPQPQHPLAEATTGYWKFTKHNVAYGEPQVSLDRYYFSDKLLNEDSEDPEGWQGSLH